MYILLYKIPIRVNICYESNAILGIVLGMQLKKKVMVLLSRSLV